jgi:hypothetical protein
MFQVVFPPIIRSSICPYGIWYMSSLLAATSSVDELALATLAVAASKLSIYQILCVQFDLLMMGGKPPETCRAFTTIKNICQLTHARVNSKQA